METEVLINNVKIMQKNSDIAISRVSEFLEEVRKLVISILGSKYCIEIGGYSITRKHPWFLNKKLFRDELRINNSSRCIINWIETIVFNSNSKYKWELLDFNFDDIEVLKDFLLKLKELFNVQLIEIQLEGIDKDLNDLKESK
jgi:hypothetical protein